MSRSLSRRLILKANAFSYEDEGRAMHERGEPCPPASRSKGKAHALWRGWQRAATDARNNKKGATNA